MSSLHMMRLSDQLQGHMSLAATVISLYVLISLALIQILGVPYVLLSGFSDRLLFASGILIITGVSTLRYHILFPLKLADARIHLVNMLDNFGDLPSHHSSTV